MFNNLKTYKTQTEAIQVMSFISCFPDMGQDIYLKTSFIKSQVQFIDAWHQIWKIRQIYFRMQKH